MLYNWYNSIANIGQVVLGIMAISFVENITGSFTYGMEIAGMFILLTLAPEIPLIRKLLKRQKEHPE